MGKAFLSLSHASAFRLCRAEASRALVQAAALSASPSPESAPLLERASACLQRAGRVAAPRRGASDERQMLLRARSLASSLLAQSASRWLLALAALGRGADWPAVAELAAESFRLGLEAERAEEASGVPMTQPASAKSSLAEAGLLEALALARLGRPEAAPLAAERLETALRMARALPEPAQTDAARRALAWGGAALWLCGSADAGRGALFESASLGSEGLESIPGGVPAGVIPA